MHIGRYVTLQVLRRPRPRMPAREACAWHTGHLPALAPQALTASRRGSVQYVPRAPTRWHRRWFVVGGGGKGRTSTGCGGRSGI